MTAAPLILGAGPAGCAAAIVMARNGAEPILLDRDAQPRDPLCGGFLSWRTAEQLRSLGVDPALLGAHPVRELRLFTANRSATLPLPQTGWGLSRHTLDTALRRAAIEAGATTAVDSIRGLSEGCAHGAERDWHSPSLFLASGKHDIRGHSRPRANGDPALGLRLRIPAGLARQDLLDAAIELHLFSGGYAGIVMQEDGSANICLALRKSRLTDASGDPQRLLADLADANPAFAQRLGSDWREGRIETIGAVPYGFIAQETEAGLFRLGDQAAVIPSLAGEGISIALASGQLAASHWLESGAAAAPAYQREFAGLAARPLRLAGLLRRAAESRWGASAATALARFVPSTVATLADATRITPPHHLARTVCPA